MKNNHINQSGDLHMIDISEKQITIRTAKASGEIVLNKQAFDSVLQLNNKKGDVLNTARIAGINAVKQTSNLIPLAHTIIISAVSIEFRIEESLNKIHCYVTVKSEGRTGVEIEALVGVEISLMTIYDMCKYLDRGMQLNNIMLLSKTGGKSGDFIKKND
jgi:cyclic pyranopterin phosphate synthase